MTYGTPQTISIYTLVVIALALVIVGNVLDMLTSILVYKIKKLKRRFEDD